MDSTLLRIWEAHNTYGFDGALAQPSDIEWEPLSGDDGIDAHGTFFPRHRGILIDERFRFNPSLASVEGTSDEAKYKVTLCLVLHEMIHQAQYQFGEADAGKHGDSFIRIATEVSTTLEIEPPTDVASAEGWPDIRYWLAHFGI